MSSNDYTNRITRRDFGKTSIAAGQRRLRLRAPRKGRERASGKRI